jgi:hypothetical protein
MYYIFDPLPERKPRKIFLTEVDTLNLPTTGPDLLQTARRKRDPPAAVSVHLCHPTV